MSVHYKTKKFNNTSTKKYITILQLLSAAFFLFTLQIWQFHGFGRISIAFFLMGVILSVLYIIETIKYAVYGQLLYNSVLDMLFKASFLLIIFGSFSEILEYLGKMYFTIIYVPLIVLIVFHFVQLIKAVPYHSIKKTCKKFLNQKDIYINFFFAIILLVIFLQFTNLWPRWDSAAYYISLEKLNATNIFQCGANGLIVCGHPASVYAILVLLIRVIPGISNLNSLYLLNLFIIFIDYLLINGIFRRLFIVKYNYFYFILAFVFICSPYILGNIANINPESICFTGLLLYIYGFTSENNYVCMVGCYTVCYSRETGVPVIAFLIFIQLIYELCSIKKRAKDYLLYSGSYYIITLIIGCIWFFTYLQGNWGENMGMEWNHLYADGTPMYEFHISFLYILDQIKGILLTNFTWVYFLVILFSGILFTVNYKKKTLRKLLEKRTCITLFGGMLISSMVICLFLTHHNFRYYIPIILFIQLLGLWSIVYISRLINNYIIRYIPMLLIGVVMFIQCFTTIDPIMLSLFPTINTGNSKIATMPWKINNFPDIQFLECARYNLQPSYFDRALDIVYKEILQEQEDSKILIYDGYQCGTEGNTLNSIWGYGYEYLEPPLWGVWNEDGEYRELSDNPENIINPLPVNNYRSIEHYLQGTDTLYYLELPWGDKLISILKEKYSGMKLFKTVKYHGWILNVYVFK